jgi:hypothetical protein
LIPAIIPVFLLIQRHYRRVAEQLSVVPGHTPPQRIQQFVLVPIDDVNYASLRAMSFARTICDEIVVLHVATDVNRADRVRQKMQANAPDLKLVVVESPLRSLMRPMLYVDALHEQRPEPSSPSSCPSSSPPTGGSVSCTTDRRATDQGVQEARRCRHILVPYVLQK